jgi:hypothetical protein
MDDGSQDYVIDPSIYMLFTASYRVDRDQVHVVKRKMFKIMDLISYLGGISGGIIASFKFLSLLISEEVIMSKLVRKMYLMRNTNYLKEHFRSFSNQNTWAFQNFEKY